MKYENENRRNEINEATAEILRAVAWVIPVIGMIYAAGLFVSQALSSPFEISCRSNMRQEYNRPGHADRLEEPVQKIVR